MSVSLIVTIAVIIFLLIFLVIGCARGFLRIILATFSLLIAVILAGALAGPLANYVETGTVIGPRIQNRIQDYVSDKLAGLPDTAEDAEEALIAALPLPAAVKQDLSDQNTAAGYVDRGVSTFSEYIAVSLSRLVIRILCFIVLFIVLYLIVRLILRLSNAINRIPVLGGINRLFGGIFGLAEGMLFLWIICLIIMMMSGTEFGSSCEKVIKDSVFLNFIYEHNIPLAIINGIIKK